MPPVTPVLAIAVALVAAGGASLDSPAASPAAARTLQGAGAAEVVKRMPTLEEQLVVAINDLRRGHGLVSLRPNAELTAVARAHSLSMAEDGYFEHSSATGAPFWYRIERKYPARGGRYWSVGENLAWGAPGLSARQAVELWLRSRPHRRMVLDRAWRDIGVGVMHAHPAPGVYGGRPATIVTADFGVRR